MFRDLLRVSLMFAAVCVGADSLPADVIELKTGEEIKGPVLKESADTIFVDVGVTVIRIPVEQIKKRTSSDSTDDPKPVKSRQVDLFRTAKLPIRSIKELTAEYGEGVVLVQTPGGLGSGFILNDRGYCVTNYHVVERETQIAVTIFHKNERDEFSKKRIDDVRIVALNPFFDLALLQVPKPEEFDFRPVYISDDDTQKEGDEVFAIGNPLGLDRSVSRGIVSTRNRNFEGIVYIQTTTQINPGNSGGPLFNSRGEVVGVTNMKLTAGEGLGFAIPIAYVKHFLSNRDAFAFDKNNPNTGFRYLEPPRRVNPNQPYEN